MKFPATGPAWPDDVRLPARIRRKSRPATPYGEVRTGLRRLRVSQPVICTPFDCDHSKYPPRIRPISGCACLPRKHLPAGANTQRHRLTRQSGLAVPPQQGSIPDRRVSIDQVGMSGGFYHIVLRLVENRVQGHRPALHGCIPNRITAARRTAYRQDRWGLARKPPGRGANG